MLGDVVKLFLCRHCRGLFVLDSQVEKHMVNCNGDAFKSPANLFACEREHFLELIAPIATGAVADENNPVSKRKRRKNDQRAKCEAENQATSSFLASTNNLNSFPSGTNADCEIHVQQSWHTQTNGGTNTQSRSQASISTADNNVSSETPLHNPSENALNNVVNLSFPNSQQSVQPVSERTNETVSSNSHQTTNGNHFSDLKEQVCESVEEDSTPATNLLVYLNKLQQGNESSVNQPKDPQGLSADLGQFSFSAVGQTEVYVLDDQHPDGGGILKSLLTSPVQSETKLAAVQSEQAPVVEDVDDDDFHFRAVATVSKFHKTQHGVGEKGGSNVYLTKHEVLPVVNDSDALVGKEGSEIGDTTVTVTPENKTSHTSISVEIPFDSSGVEMQLCKNVERVPKLHAETTEVAGLYRKHCSTLHVAEATEGVPAETPKEEGNVHASVLYILEPDGSLRPVALDDITEGTDVNSMYAFTGQDLNYNKCTKDDSNNQEAGNSLSSQLNVTCSPLTKVVTDSDNPLAQVGVNNKTLSSVGYVTDSAVSAKTGVINNSLSSQVDVYSNPVSEINVANSLPSEVNVSTYQSRLCNSVLETAETGIMTMYGNDTVAYIGNTKSEVTASKNKSKNKIRLAELRALREEVLQQSTELAPDGESKKTRYHCNVCGHVAMSVKFMHNHLQMHTNGKMFYECDQCDFKSRRRCKVVEHQRRHTRSRLLCHLCPATFMDIASLNRHVTCKHTDSPSLKCNQCEFSASHASDLREHMVKHTGELLCCEVEGCGYRTPYLRAMRVHHKRHANEKKYQCNYCSYKTVEKSVLTRHMRSHTQERPYQCSICAFRANTMSIVIRHKQHVHQQKKNIYVCDKCPFQTAYAGSIAKHLRTHMGDFTCPLCIHSSRSFNNIKKHVREVHQLDTVEVVEKRTKINTKDYLHADTPQVVEAGLTKLHAKNYLPPDSEKPLIEPMMTDALNVDSQDLPPLAMSEMDQSHIDPMKLSFHFQDLAPGPSMAGSSGTNLTRSSSIPDLFTFSGMNRSNSQSDLLNFPGLSTITRSNSMSDLVSFASSMCVDSVEPVNLDVSLSDASAPSMDVSALSLDDGPEASLASSPSSVMQCSKCLGLLMNRDDVDAHRKVCTGSVQLV